MTNRDLAAGSEIPAIIRALYAPETFRGATAIWSAKLADHLQRVSSGEGSVLNWREPAEAVRAAAGFLDSAPADSGGDPGTLLNRFAELVDQILRSGQNLHHPHYIGHQVPASVPLAGLFDAIGALTNQVMAVYEMGPWSTAVELALIGKLAQKIGWDETSATGLLTHGGSLANLTALLTARNVALPGCWEQGVPRDAVLLVNADAHYCVSRAAGILGLGTQQVIRVAPDEDRRMDPDQLDLQLSRLRREQRTVVAVSACACATPTGAFDRLDQIAAVCRRHDVWLHVDAAHGGSALMSRRHRELLTGIDQADSVVWDAHKMLFVPALCAAVLYRSGEHCYETFRQSAPYLFDPSAPGLADYDPGLRTVECTKRAAGFGLWGLWSVAGDGVFEQLVDHTFALGRTLHRLLCEASDFEPLHRPECNIVAFRLVPESLRGAPDPMLDQLQREVRTQLIRSGRFYIVQTTLDGRAALRATVMNPLTTESDLYELLDELRQLGKTVTASLIRQ